MLERLCRDISNGIILVCKKILEACQSETQQGFFEYLGYLNSIQRRGS